MRDEIQKIYFEYKMAKSLRSKNVLRAKSIKRNKDFQTIEDKRRQRIAEKMKEELSKQETVGSKLTSADDMKDEEKKISTHGWRDSRNLKYKKGHKSKKKNKSTNF